MAGPSHLNEIESSLCDRTIEVRIDEIQAGRRPPMAEQAALDVLRTQRLAEQRVRQQVDLPYGEIVRCPPVGVDPRELVIGQWLPVDDLHAAHPSTA